MERKMAVALPSRPLAGRSSSTREAAVAVAQKIAMDSFKQHPWVVGLCRYVDLADADINAIQSILEEQRQIRKRADIVVQGYKYRKLCFINSGMAIRYKLLHNGKRQILGVLLPGDIIGFPASFYERANFSIAAITDMGIQGCSFEAFMQASCKRPLLAMALLWLAVEETATYADHIIDTGRRAPFERVAHFFLELHSRLKAVGHATTTTFELPLSQEEIGDVLGLSAPHINRVLRRLREDGLVTIDAHTVTLNDMEALQAMTQFEPLTPVPSPIFRKRG
jgi:CRP-like cAMP-binding protein